MSPVAEICKEPLLPDVPKVMVGSCAPGLTLTSDCKSVLPNTLAQSGSSPLGKAPTNRNSPRGFSACTASFKSPDGPSGPCNTKPLPLTRAPSTEPISSVLISNPLKLDEKSKATFCASTPFKRSFAVCSVNRLSKLLSDCTSGKTNSPLKSVAPLDEM